VPETATEKETALPVSTVSLAGCAVMIGVWALTSEKKEPSSTVAANKGMLVFITANSDLRQKAG